MQSPRTTDALSLRDTVVDEDEKLATSFTTIHAMATGEQVGVFDPKMTYWPEALIQVNPNDEQGALRGDHLEPGEQVSANGRTLTARHRPAGAWLAAWVQFGHMVSFGQTHRVGRVGGGADMRSGGWPWT
jgi:hypothetical protein